MEVTPEQIAARREELKRIIQEAQAELASFPPSDEEIERAVNNIL